MRRTMLICAVVVVTWAPAWAGHPTSFETVMKHYEPIRLALLGDSTKGVAENGKAIENELEALHADFSHERVGASHEVMMVVEEKLPDMIASAKVLADAASIEDARTAFYELSVSLVRWQEGMPEQSRPRVAYCSMYKRSWLQPGDEIGNPYGDMPRCGSIVSR